jgi:hypothetical protein
VLLLSLGDVPMLLFWLGKSSQKVERRLLLRICEIMAHVILLLRILGKAEYAQTSPPNLLGTITLYWPIYAFACSILLMRYGPNLMRTVAPSHALFAGVVQHDAGSSTLGRALQA